MCAGIKKCSFDDEFLGRLTLAQVLPLAENLSGKSRVEIADHPAFRCKFDVLQRALNPYDDSYFVTFGRVPDLSVALGHDLLLRWALARFAHLQKHFGLDLDKVPPVDLSKALAEFAAITKELGDVAGVMAQAAQDGTLDLAECRHLLREILDLIATANHLYAGLAARVQEGE